MRDWAIVIFAAVLWLVSSGILGTVLFHNSATARDIAFSPRSTALIIVGTPIFLGVLDVLLATIGGNESTISYVMLTIRASRPLVAIAMAYSFGVLLGHLFFPQFTADPPYASEVIGRMFVVLSPTLYALTIISAGNGTCEAHTRALEAGGHLPLAGYMIAAAILGGLAGKYVLPQHLYPS